MRETEETILNEEIEITAGTLAAIALKAAYWFLIVSALFCTLFVSLFPYTSMRMYYGMGLRHKTFEMAEQVVSRARKNDIYYGGEAVPVYDSKFADGLYWSINLATEFMDADIQKFGYTDARTQDNARKVFRYADMYLPAITPFGTLETEKEDAFAVLRNGRNKLVDDALRAATAKQYHPAISYENTVRANRIRAMYMSQNFEWFLAYVIGNFNILSTAPLTETEMDGQAILFNELNAVIRMELESLEYPSPPPRPASKATALCPVSPFPYLYTGSGFIAGITVYEQDKLLPPIVYMQNRVAEFKDYIYAYPAANSAEFLKRAYWARSLSELTANICLVTQFLHEQNPANAVLAALKSDWEACDEFVAGDKAYASLNEWYGAVLQDYVKAS